MKPAADIRVENLLFLIREHGGQKELAERIQKSPGQVSQWATRAPNSATGQPRTIGHKSARQIESALALPTGWMDQDHSPAELKSSFVEPPTIEALMNELAPRLRRATPHIRKMIGQALMDYSTNPEEGPEIAKTIRALLDAEV